MLNDLRRIEDRIAERELSLPKKSAPRRAIVANLRQKKNAVVNVACLNRAPFEEILSGEKRNEYRIRKRPDPRLEAVRPGEKLVFLERGTERALQCIVMGCERFDPHDPNDPDGDYDEYCYDIAFDRVKLISAPGVRHLQGWSRRESL